MSVETEKKNFYFIVLAKGRNMAEAIYEAKAMIDKCNMSQSIEVRVCGTGEAIAKVAANGDVSELRSTN